MDVRSADGLPQRLRRRCWTAGRATSGSAPAEAEVPHDRRYLPGTLVLETSWNVGEGWLIVRDALVMGPVAGR